MNYHIMVDSKFIDGYINDVYEIGYEAENVFFIRGSEEDNQQIKNTHRVKWIGEDYDLFLKSFSKQLKEGDQLFIHWYDQPMGKFALQLPKDVIVHAVVWGGEFLEDPYLHHRKYLYERKTLHYIDTVEEDKMRNNLKTRHLPSILFLPLKKIKLKIETRKQFAEKKKQVHRLDYIVLHAVNSGDTKAIKQIYQYQNLKRKAGFYDLNFDRALNINQVSKKESISIMINNAAFLSGNHLDAFEVLKKLNGNFHFYCPLSYVAGPYRDMVLEKGKTEFGEKFFPLTEFMQRDDYMKFLGQMDALFFYQNIGQGFGNIVAALTMGKPVFLRKINTQYELLINMGIKIYDADNIANTNLGYAIKEAFASREHNIAILQKEFSKEKRLVFLKETLA